MGNEGIWTPWIVSAKAPALSTHEVASMFLLERSWSSARDAATHLQGNRCLSTVPLAGWYPTGIYDRPKFCSQAPWLLLQMGNSMSVKFLGIKLLT